MSRPGTQNPPSLCRGGRPCPPKGSCEFAEDFRVSEACFAGRTESSAPTNPGKDGTNAKKAARDTWAAGAMLQAYVTKARVMLQEHYNSRGALDLWRAMDYDTAR